MIVQQPHPGPDARVRTKAYGGTAYLQPFLDWLRALGPGIHHIDPIRVGATLGMKPASVRRELGYLAEAKLCKYDADGSGLISVRTDI